MKQSDFASPGLTVAKEANSRTRNLATFKPLSSLQGKYRTTATPDNKPSLTRWRCPTSKPALRGCRKLWRLVSSFGTAQSVFLGDSFSCQAQAQILGKRATKHPLRSVLQATKHNTTVCREGTGVPRCPSVGLLEVTDIQPGVSM